MLKFVGAVLLIVAFSFTHVAFAQCQSDARCGVWDVIDSGCEWNTLGCGTSGGTFPNCNLIANHCCYFEFGSCVRGGFGTFYFKKCYVGGCTYT